MTHQNIFKKSGAALLAWLILLTSPMSAFGFEGLNPLFIEDLNKGIRYYNRENGENCSGSVLVDESGTYYQTAYRDMENNMLAKDIYAKLKSFGLDDLHTAAVVGNFYAEGMNTAYSPVRNSSVGLLGGYGLAQWGGDRTSGSPADGSGRDGGLYRYAVSKGESGLEAGWETQVEYAWAEMTGQGPAAEYATVQYNHQTFLSKNTIDDAAEYFRAAYERGAWSEKRQNAAQAAYKLFYGVGGSPLCIDTSGSDDIAAAAIQLSSGDWAGGCYDFGGGHGSYEDLLSRIEAKFRPLNSKGVDCSGFAMAVVSYVAGRHVRTPTFTTPNPNNDWTKISTPIPGAMSISATHIEVITKVENGRVTETVGSHTTGCGNGFGPSISGMPFDDGNYFKFTGEIERGVQ